MNRIVNILLVEDDLNLGFLLVEFLESKGFSVKLYRDGLTALAGFQNGNFDFCILDVMLPKMDGFTLAKKLKILNDQIPMVFLTARSMKEDKVKGYELGADDYITKPFDEDELFLKINAILSRTNLSKTAGDNLFQIGRFNFDYLNQSLEIEGENRRLTERESNILKVLCLSKNKVIRREQILTAIWGENDYFAGRSLDVFISKLRKYFSSDPTIRIENIPKVGFILQD
ncbi:MAG: response regulator transcription factor [Methylococcaceae bacterium]|nr:response regulator transcription factor [Prolixibacteraceae bacterium]